MCSKDEFSVVEDIEEKSCKVDESEVDYSQLDNYAYFGTVENMDKMFDTLSNLAEEEKWTYDESKPNSALKYYIFRTFTQCKRQDKVLESADGNLSCFNTGLLTKNGNDILALFVKNRKEGYQPWVLVGFFDRCYRQIMDSFSTVPQLASYDDDSQSEEFHLEDNLVLNLDHILDDNWDRITGIIPFGKKVTRTLLVGVVEEAKAKIKRNKRLVIPQYYKNKMMYLVPIDIPVNDEQCVTMALAVEKTETNQYRANTIFTKEMAYPKARLIMKPDSSWLIN